MSSGSSSRQTSTYAKLFGHERPLYELLGKGKAADIIMWRNKPLSGGILIGFTMTWFLFEVMEYHFITLLCHTSILAMLVLFIWSNFAPLVDMPPPESYVVKLAKEVQEKIAVAFPRWLSMFMTTLQEIARGKDLKVFLLTIGFLWILSVIGSSCSFLTLFYLASLSILTLPALYEQYKTELQHYATEGRQDLKKLYKKIDSKVLNKIPRKPGKDK
ncbi:reticulon-like protein B2 [Typha angustifolia]|uniref:reticulon-like protein B2 n=1 Tax=Typha angustifolia TaxID=59011 RepID=UPI003C2F8823